LPIFFLHDIRVTGETPQCDVSIRIGPTDDLGSQIRNLANRIDREYQPAGWYHVLHLLCHGFPQGLQLGSAFLTQMNVHSIFGPLRNRVGSLLIHGCGAAAVYNHGATPSGPYDGERLCSLMASTVAAQVTASNATQFYLPSGSITNSSGRNRLSDWQGTVGTWNEQGHLTGQTTPSQRAFQ